MSNKKRLLYCALVAVVLLAALAIYNRCSSRAEVVKVERDTVVIHDTVPYYHPAPKDSAIVKYVTRYLPVVKNDTIDHFADVSKMIHDSVAVEVPITSKHYGSKDYDAWVSGFEVSLDSIKVYKETQYITETITRTVKENKHFFVGVAGGTEYNPDKQTFAPLAELRMTFKKNRWGVGVAGGCQRTGGKFEPFVKGMVSYDMLSF